jgi:HD-GYP domain-containing protein (c-di-GMP phosphodiesterase class II)
MDSVDLREVNPHLLENLIQASEQEQIVVGEDIYDTRGIKLLANGYPIETSTREKLLFRTLQKPLETSLRAQNLDIADAIRSEVNWLLEQHPAVSLMFAGLDNEGRDIALTPIDNLPRLLLSIAYLNHEKSFKHAVLVTMLSRAIARAMGYEAAFFRPLTQAALAHDLGELYLDPSYLYTNVRLSAKQWKMTMQHPELGWRLIKQYTKYGTDVARAVYEHHERENGSGYPKKLTGAQISPMGKILMVGEVLAGLLLKPSYPMRRAQLVLKLIPNEYDKKVLDAVHQLSAQHELTYEATHTFVSLESVLGVFRELITIDKMLKRYLMTPVSVAERELVNDVLKSLVEIKKALSSLGLDYCMTQDGWRSVESDHQIRMEMDVAAREVAWRLRDRARDMLLNFSDQGIKMSPELHTVFGLMSQCSLSRT